MADALASGASVLYGRGGSSPPSPTAKILGSVKASEDFFVCGGGWSGVWVEAEADAELRLLACPLPPPLTLSGTYGQVSGTYRCILDLSMLFRHLCARCGPGSFTCRCAIHLWTRCSASIGE